MSNSAPQQPQQPQQPYVAPQTPQAPPYLPAPPTNVLAIIAFVSVFVLPSIVPVILGHISMSQIKRTGEGGRGLALAALIIGYIELAFAVLMIIFLMLWVVGAITLFGVAASSLDTAV